MKIYSLLVLLPVLITKASSQEECPGVLCAEDPCEGSMCPRFYNAECRPNRCSCTPEFFFRNRNVTARCAVRTCDTRECPGTRQCIEEVRPPACPAERPNCRQALHTRCFLPPDTDRPMTCLDMTCMEGEVCRMRERDPPFFPVVNCWPPERVSDCVPGTCNDGLECVDDGPSVRCISPEANTTTPSPTSDTPSPSPNATASMPPNMTVSPPPNTTVSPPPNTTERSSCDQLRCGQISSICVEDDNGPRCEQPTSCEELAPFCLDNVAPIEKGCNEFLGFPQCGPLTNCDQLVCGNLERCSLIQFPPFLSSVAICLSTQVGLSCEDLVCPEDDNRCALTSIPDQQNATLATCSTANRLAPFVISCNEQSCATLETCVEMTQFGLVYSSFCTETGCENIGCPSGSTCVTDLLEVPTNSACVPPDPTFSIRAPCSNREETCPDICHELFLAGGTFLGSFCADEMVPLVRSCNELTCGSDELCVTSFFDENPEFVIATCIDRFGFLFSLSLYQGNLILPEPPVVGSGTSSGSIGASGFFSGSGMIGGSGIIGESGSGSSRASGSLIGSGSGSGRCEELRCEQFLEICEEDNLGARCVAPSGCEMLEPLCDAENSTCTEFLGSAICLPPSSCELITCGEFERCVETRFLGVINTTIANCLPSTQGLNCEELKCQPGFDVCRLSEIPNEPDTTLAQCAQSINLMPRSCDELFVCTFLFDDEERICVDVTQDGVAFNQICTSLNCEDRGCPFSSRCVPFTDMPFTSACDISVSSFGITCSDRVCTGGEVCQEIVLNGTYTLGSFCGQRVITQRSCNDTICSDSQVCTMVTYNTDPEIVRGECTDRESYFFSLRNYQGIFVIPTEDGSGSPT